jgi:hypothetical protein
MPEAEPLKILSKRRLSTGGAFACGTAESYWETAQSYG